MAAKGSPLYRGTTHGIYVPKERQEEYRLALRKVQRRRPGKSTSDLMIDVLVEAAARYQDIPGLDDLPLEEYLAAPATAAV